MGNLSIRCGIGKRRDRSWGLPQRSSTSMSFGWLFLGGMLSSRARLRFPNQGQHAVNLVRRSSIFHRTANYLLTGCLTPGGKRNSTQRRIGEPSLLGAKDQPMLLAANGAAKGLLKFERYRRSGCHEIYQNQSSSDGGGPKASVHRCPGGKGLPTCPRTVRTTRKRRRPRTRRLAAS